MVVVLVWSSLSFDLGLTHHHYYQQYNGGNTIRHVTSRHVNLSQKTSSTWQQCRLLEEFQLFVTLRSMKE